MVMMRQLWSANALSLEFGLDRRTVGKRLENVPPAGESRSGSPGWRLKDVIAPLCGSSDEPLRRLDYQQEKARAAKAQADKIERENAVAEGKLLVAEEWIRLDEAVMTAIRDAFLALPDGVAEQVCEIAVADGPVGVSAFLRERIEALLTDASNAEFELEDEAA